MRVPLGEWLPDLPALANPGLTIAKNAVPRGNGYGPMASLVSMGAGVLTNYARGAIAGLDRAANPYNFAADQSKLYRLGPAGLADVTRASGPYSAGDSERWEFLQFDDLILATQYSDAIQFFDMASSTLFADLSLTAPRARHIGVVGRHVFVGNTYDGTDGPVPNRVWWPAIDNPFSWPDPFSTTAIAVQSGRRDLDAGAGWIQAVVQGTEIGAVFQERSIHRADYVGGDVMYEFHKAEPHRGCLIAGLAVPWGREILYCAEDGFWLFDYTGSQPVGEEKINRTFLADVDPAFFDRVSWAVDPDRPLCFIAYPGVGHSGGTPNKILVYHFQLRKFALIEAQLELVCRVLTPGVHLDTLPDDNLDTFEPTTSFDARQAGVGGFTLGGYNTSHAISRFDGAALEAVFETGDIEFSEGRRSFLSKVRPLVKGATANVQIAPLRTQGSAITYGPKLYPSVSGECPARSDGRYHRLRMTIPAGGFTEASGLEVASRASGKR